MTVQGGLVPALAHRLAHPAADHRARAVVARRPVQRGTGGAAPLPRRRRRRRRRQHGRRPALRRGRLGQPGHQGRHPARRSAGDTTLQAGDDVLVLADPDETPALERYFTDPAAPTPQATPSPPAAGRTRPSCALEARAPPRRACPRVARRPQLPTLTDFGRPQPVMRVAVGRRETGPEASRKISVRAKGLEPPRCFHQQDLNLPRLPFRHARAPAPGRPGGWVRLSRPHPFGMILVF